MRQDKTLPSTLPNDLKDYNSTQVSIMFHVYNTQFLDIGKTQRKVFQIMAFTLRTAPLTIRRGSCCATHCFSSCSPVQALGLHEAPVGALFLRGPSFLPTAAGIEILQ